MANLANLLALELLPRMELHESYLTHLIFLWVPGDPNFDPHACMAHVIKIKYFKKSNFLANHPV